MVRSAFLPDSETLSRLIHGLRAAREPEANTQQHSGLQPADAGLPEPPTSTVPPVPPTRAPSSAESEVDEVMLLGEVAGQVNGASSLERGFASLCTWLEVRTNARGVFVADAEGLAVVGAAGYERYVAAASEIADVLLRLKLIAPDLGQGATTLALGGGEQLVLIGAHTDLGRFSVGVLVNRPLAPVWTTVIQQALCQVAKRREITG